MSLDQPVIAPDLTYLGRAIKKGTRPVPSWTVYVHVISRRCTLERNEEWLRKMALEKIEYIAKLEAALQSVIDYEPFCPQGQETGMCTFECPTCVARKALGDMEDEVTRRMGNGEKP